MTEFACVHCGATGEFWAWYPDPTRQTIELLGVDEKGWIEYDYTGSTKAGDAGGDDDGYMCGGCSAYAEHLEELVGLPVPPTPATEKTLSALEAAQILHGEVFYEDDADDPVDWASESFASGADVCEWLAEHFGFTADDYRTLHEQTLAVEAARRAAR